MKRKRMVQRDPDRVVEHPYRQFACDVIQLAFEDIHKRKPKSKPAQKAWLRNRETARNWIERGNMGELTFNQCCMITGISGLRLKRGILKNNLTKGS